MAVTVFVQARRRILSMKRHRAACERELQSSVLEKAGLLAGMDGKENQLNGTRLGAAVLVLRVSLGVSLSQTRT